MPREDPSKVRAIQLLSPALGEALARESVENAARTLGVGSTWSPSDLRAVVDEVARQPGLVGITARVVGRRLIMGDRATVASDPHLERVPPSGAGPPSSRGGKSLDALAELLAPALGDERARAAVAEASRALDIGPRIALPEAMRLLEHIAKTPGVVGISARFAKTRLHLLRW